MYQVVTGVKSKIIGEAADSYLRWRLCGYNVYCCLVGTNSVPPKRLIPVEDRTYDNLWLGRDSGKRHDPD